MASGKNGLKRQKIERPSLDSAIAPLVSQTPAVSNPGPVGFPARGRNPIEQVARKPGPAGRFGEGQAKTGERFGSISAPTRMSGVTVPYIKAPWYQGGQSISKGRFGAEALLRNSGGPIAATNFAAANFVTDTIGFQTNHRVNYSKISRGFKTNIMETLQMHMLVITAKEVKDPALTRRSGESRRYTQLNVPAWNYCIARTQKRAETFNDVKLADDIWKKWTVEGIVVSEEGQEEPHHRDEIGKERLLNNTIRGYVYAFNIWGDNVRAGTKLWLILKQVPIDGIFVLNTFGAEPQNIDMKNPEVSTRPFQLIPWAHHAYDSPPDSELIYEDDFGFRHRGKTIYVGRAERGTYKLGERHTGEMSRSVQTIIAQGQIFMFVDP